MRKPVLTEDQKRRVRRLSAEEGLSHGQLAERFGVSKAVVYRVIHEKEATTGRNPRAGQDPMTDAR